MPDQAVGGKLPSSLRPSIGRAAARHIFSLISRLLTFHVLYFRSLLTVVLGPLISYSRPLPVSVGTFVSLAGAAFHGLGQYLSCCLPLCQGCDYHLIPEARPRLSSVGQVLPGVSGPACLHQPSSRAGSVSLHCSSHSWTSPPVMEHPLCQLCPRLSVFLFFLTLCVLLARWLLSHRDSVL